MTDHERIMKAARHLSATRMAWAANRLISGHDYRGCTKTRIAKALAKRLPQGLDDVIYELQTSPNAKGRIALSVENLGRARAEVEKRQALMAEQKERVKAARARGKTNYGAENKAHEHRLRLDVLEPGVSEVAMSQPERLALILEQAREALRQAESAACLAQKVVDQLESLQGGE